ncbi:MAG TPA: sugar ABC transporter substrate-binding protein [Modestobacter sp.]|nr:sugar ABC transporter substrate-binding protein [Modestobacter sp.]
MRTRSTTTVRTGSRARLSRVALATALVATVAACGGTSDGGDSGGGGGGGGKDPSDVNIAFIAADGSQNFAQEMMDGARAAGEEFGVDVTVLAPTKLDGPAQVKLFQDAMRTATDGIAIETLTPDLLVRAEAQAVGQGLPVVAVDTVPPADAAITTYVGNDNLAAGSMLAAAAIEALGTETTGTAVIGNTVPGVPVLDYRAEGMKQAFADGAPGFEVLGPFDTKPDPTQNAGAWSNLVNAHSDARVFMGTGDPDNASLARINRDTNGKYLTAAFDLNQAGLQAVQDGVNFGIADPQHFMKGYIATRLLIEKALDGTELPDGWWVSPSEMVTQANVAEILARQESIDTKLAWYRDRIDEAFANPPVKPVDQAK